MRNLAIRTFLICGLMCTFLILPLSAQEMSTEERQVWAMEEKYWKYLETGDSEGYMTLWHEDFVGWPGGAPKPVGKTGIRRSVQSDKEQGWKLIEYELRPEAVQLFGNVAVTHYAGTGVWKNDSGESDGQDEWFRITHTWMKSGEKWQIIGGMSAPIPESSR